MEGPRELLRRAAQLRRAAPRQSAPAKEPPRPAASEHHASYEALMRSHDRMRTRHLPVQGGGGRA